MSDEFYRDEHPQDPSGGGGGGPGGGGGGSVGGGSWGGGSGGGGGGGGMGAPNWGGGGSGGGDGDDDDRKGEWIEGEHISAPYLKISQGQHLWTDDNCYLFLGCCQCYIAPQVLVYIRGDSELKHTDCALLRLVDTEREIELFFPSYEEELIDNSGRPVIYMYFPWTMPGRFKLQAKWQRGHYPHAEIHAMRFIAFGIDLGWRTVPLAGWVDIASIAINDEYVITVNGLKAEINGNASFVET